MDSWEDWRYSDYIEDSEEIVSPQQIYREFCNNNNLAENEDSGRKFKWYLIKNKIK